MIYVFKICNSLSDRNSTLKQLFVFWSCLFYPVMLMSVFHRLMILHMLLVSSVLNRKRRIIWKVQTFNDQLVIQNHPHIILSTLNKINKIENKTSCYFFFSVCRTSTSTMTPSNVKYRISFDNTIAKWTWDYDYGACFLSSTITNMEVKWRFNPLDWIVDALSDFLYLAIRFTR